MNIKERRELEKEVCKVLDDIKDTKEYIAEYEEMIYVDREEIDVVGCTRWLIQLKEQLRDQEYELENMLESNY